MGAEEKLGGVDGPKQAARKCLLLCARCRGEDARSLASLISAGIDWPYLLEVGGRHGLLPLAYERLRHLPSELIPPSVLAGLQKSYYAILRRNLRLVASLAEAVAALQAAGIEAIVLKGGALAGTVYPDPGHRPMVDVDLLVPLAEMGNAGNTLASIGYSLSGGLSPRMVAFQQRFGGGLEWLRDSDFGKVHIDLQHDLVGIDLCRHAFAVEPASLWARARALPLTRGEALQLSPEDTLIHLCLHPALHHGYTTSLMGYVDMDRVIAREGSGHFWKCLVERARQTRTRTALYFGLRSARELLGTPVPEHVLAALEPRGPRGRAVPRLAPLGGDRLWERTEQAPSGLRQLLLYGALMERPWDTVRMVWAILFPSSEWLAVRYGIQGEGRARLYSVVHPLRVARALLRSLHRPLVQSGLE